MGRFVATLAFVLTSCAALTDYDAFRGEAAPAPLDDDAGDAGAPKDAGRDADAAPSAPPALVQSGTGGATGLTIPATLDKPTTEGNLLIVVVAVEDPLKGSVAKVEDDAGNDYVSANARSVATDTTLDVCTGGISSEIWYAKNIKKGARSVQVKMPVSIEANVWLLEVSGVTQLGAAARTDNALVTTKSAAAPKVDVKAPRSFIVSTACACEDVEAVLAPFHGLARLNGEGTAWLIADAPGSYGAVWDANEGVFNASTAAFTP